MALTVGDTFINPPDDPLGNDPNADPNADLANDALGDTRDPGIDTAPPLPVPGADTGMTATEQTMLDQARAHNADLNSSGQFGDSTNNFGLPSATGLPGAPSSNPAPNQSAAPALPSGDESPNQNLSLSQQVQANRPGRLPGSPGAPAAESGLPAQYRDDPWAQTFYKDFGYFDPRFNSRDAFLANAQRGDAVIRGAGGGVDQLARMAQTDPSARAVLDSINAAPDFYHSQNAAAWDQAHNAQVTGRLNAGEFGSNQQAIRNIGDQMIQTPASPVDNYHALMSNSLRTGLEDTLKNLGATNVQTTIDPYGNTVIAYQNRSGQPETIKATLPDMAQALETLRQRTAAAAGPPPTQPAATAPPESYLNPTPPNATRTFIRHIGDGTPPAVASPPFIRQLGE